MRFLQTVKKSDFIFIPSQKFQEQQQKENCPKQSKVFLLKYLVATPPEVSRAHSDQCPALRPSLHPNLLHKKTKGLLGIRNSPAQRTSCHCVPTSCKLPGKSPWLGYSSFLSPSTSVWMTPRICNAKLQKCLNTIPKRLANSLKSLPEKLSRAKNISFHLLEPLKTCQIQPWQWRKWPLCLV